MREITKNKEDQIVSFRIRKDNIEYYFKIENDYLNCDLYPFEGDPTHSINNYFIQEP